jgi:hypothetical protein
VPLPGKPISGAKREWSPGPCGRRFAPADGSMDSFLEEARRHGGWETRYPPMLSSRCLRASVRVLPSDRARMALHARSRSETGEGPTGGDSVYFNLCRIQDGLLRQSRTAFTTTSFFLKGIIYRKRKLLGQCPMERAILLAVDPAVDSQGFDVGEKRRQKYSPSPFSFSS